MFLLDRILKGKAHIGFVGYSILAEGYRVFCNITNNKRLRKQNYSHDDLIIKKNIRYKESHSKYHLLDIYKSKDNSKGTIIMIHGGGLMFGKKELNRFSCMELARYGYDVVAISYPLAPEKSFYNQVLDCYESLSFIKKKACVYQLNMNHVFLFGDSAGGLLSYTLEGILTNKDIQRKFNVEDIDLHIDAMALVSVMSHIERNDTLNFPFRCAIHKKDKKKECYSILCDSRELLTSSFAPAIMSTSDLDMLREDSLDLYERMKKLNVHCQLHDYKSKENRLEHVFPITAPKLKESQEFFGLVNAFFEKFTNVDRI